MTVFLYVLFALCCIAECVCVPIFLKYQWPVKCWKSFRWKMVCSTLFIVIGLLACKIANNHTEYASMIMWGLVFGWLGDLFLHIVSDKLIFSGLGLITFLIGHLFYISAFQKAIYLSYPDASAVTWYEIIFVLMMAAIAVLFVKLKSLKIPTVKAIPAFMYLLTISYMLIKAIRMCVATWAYGMNDNLPIIVLTTGIGAILFVLSDGSLGMIMAGIKADSFKFKCFNIGTYFAAQVLLASSIFVIYTRSFIM